MRALSLACVIAIGAVDARAAAQTSEPPSDETSDAPSDELPASVRLLVPTCAPGVSWRALSRALEVELRTMGSRLATDGVAALRLALDLPCEGEPTEATVTLVHVASGRTRADVVSLGDTRGRDRVRALALGLSEIVRLRYAELAREPEPPPPPPPPPPPDAVVDVARFDAQITRAAREAARTERPPEPEPPAPPEVLLDLSFGIHGYPAANNAASELRAGFSFRTPTFRLGFDVLGGGGWASSLAGEVALGSFGGGVAVRFAHGEHDWLIASGLRVDVSYVRAAGVGSLEAGFDAVHLAALLDARVRFRVGDDAWFLFIPEVGAALVGADVRVTAFDGPRVTAQIGPRIGLSVGLSLDVR